MQTKPFYLHADFAFASDVQGLPRSFSGVAYSGGIARDYFDQVVIDLASLSTSPAMPLLLQHDPYEVIGAITGSSITDAGLMVSGELFSDIDDKAASIAKKHQRGARYQMSVGLFDATREDVPAGKKASINGQTFDGPLMILKNGIVREVSVVALGSDPQTSASFFSQPDSTTINHKEKNTMDEDKLRITELETQLAEARQELDGKQAELEQIALSARTAAVKDLFAAVSKEFTAESSAPYLSMTADQFSAASADLKAAGARQLDPKLFSQQVTDGAEAQAKPVTTLSLTGIYALRAEQAKGA